MICLIKWGRCVGYSRYAISELTENDQYKINHKEGSVHELRGRDCTLDCGSNLKTLSAKLALRTCLGLVTLNCRCTGNHQWGYTTTRQYNVIDFIIVSAKLAFNASKGKVQESHQYLSPNEAKVAKGFGQNRMWVKDACIQKMFWHSSGWVWVPEGRTFRRGGGGRSLTLGPIIVPSPPSRSSNIRNLISVTFSRSRCLR